MFKQILFFFIILSNVSYAQLSNKHWLPPLHARDGNVVSQHYIYLSTPYTTPFQVTVTNGTGTPIAGSPFTISQSTPVRVTVGNSQPSVMFLDLNDVNKVKGSKGLILEASKEFYVSFKVRSTNHAEILVPKGKTALGTMFRLGSLPQEYDSSIRNFVSSFMATEDNTTVTLSDYDSGVIFASSNGSIITSTQTFNLNSGECVVVSGYTNSPGNLTGFVGALLSSNKPIVVNSGNATGGLGPDPGNGSSGQDFNLDQIVGYNNIGSEYVVVKGNGSDITEKPLIIATEDNTKVYLNGNPTAITTLNAGDYFLIPTLYYLGNGTNKNMYINSDKPIYVYQILGGQISDATSGLNFIPPLSCYWQKSVNMIPDFNLIGNFIYNDSEIIIVTKTGASVTINGNPILSSANIVTGNPDWETYRVAGNFGDIVVESTEALAVGVFGSDGNAAGFGGYYSGFGSVPENTNFKICTNETVDLYDAIEGNPIAGGNWTPALSSGTDIFDPTVDAEGTYTYSYDITCDGLTISESVDISVTFEQPPFAGNNNSLVVCQSDTEIDLFPYLGTGVGSNGTWQPALTSGTNIFNPATDTFGSYTYSISGTAICSAVSSTITITTNPVPEIIPISDYLLCDNAADGSDTNGIVTFDLSTKSTEILNNQLGITVTYHTSSTDANTGDNTIAVITSNDTTIYVRLTNNTTGCFATTSFELKVLSLPVAANTISLKQCDTDTDAITNFNLTEANSIISTDATNTFSYHTTFLGAQNDTDRITNELSYTAPNGAQVWARTTNTAGCIRTSLVNLIVSTTTIPLSHKFMLYACDEYLSPTDPAGDGFAYFNLDNADVTQNAVQNLLSFFSTTQPLVVSFYENEMDALAETNAIQNITNYRNITPLSQFIWARIDSELNNECYATGPYIQLIATPLPEINLGPDFIICVDPITGLGSKNIDATPAIAGNYSYQWTPVNPAGASPIYEVTTEGAFSVIVTNITTNCETTATVNSAFSSEPVTFEANLVTPAFATGLSTIEGIATGGFGVYEYSINGIDWQSSPSFTDLENGNYIIYVRDIQGCGVLFSQEIQTITYPSYFTPNEDGFNDYWNINLPTQYEGKISIYDRYGKLLSKISSQEQGWNGTYNGKSLPSTDYWFRVEYIENNQKKEFKSHFSLIR